MYIIGITKAIRKAIGKQPGDTIEVTIKKDDKSRLMEIPMALNDALDNNSAAKDFFVSLTDSQKNKFFTFITSAKRQETVDKRLVKIVQMLENSEKMK